MRLRWSKTLAGCWLLVALLPVCALAMQAGGDTTSANAPVKEIAPGRLHVDLGKMTGVLPLYMSADWTKPQPSVTRALIVFHGKLRNADEYNHSGLAAIA